MYLKDNILMECCPHTFVAHFLESMETLYFVCLSVHLSVTKILTFTIIFEPVKVELSYFTCTVHPCVEAFLFITKNSDLVTLTKTCSYQIFLPCDLKGDLCPTYIVSENFTCNICHNFWPSDLDRYLWPTYLKIVKTSYLTDNTINSSRS